MHVCSTDTCSTEVHKWLKHKQYNFLKKKNNKYFKIAYCYTSRIWSLSYTEGKTPIITNCCNMKIWNSHVGKDIPIYTSWLLILSHTHKLLVDLTQCKYVISWPHSCRWTLLLEKMQFCVCLVKNLPLKHIRYQWHSLIHLGNRNWSQGTLILLLLHSQCLLDRTHTEEKRKMAAPSKT